MDSIFSLQPHNLNSINAERAVKNFRDLLWCHARRHGLSVTKVHITSRVNVSDGGVDAKIDDNIESVRDELLVVAGTCYQIKTGSTFQPWQPNKLRKELFGKTNANIDIANLVTEVRRCLENSNRYIIACFGVDPTG